MGSGLWRAGSVRPAALIACGVLLAVVLMALVRDARFLMVMGVFAGLVVLALLGWRVVLGVREKGRAGPLARLLTLAGRAPVTDAGLAARLDDQARSFNEGLSKYKAAGKNLYSLPWYLMVGPPAAGKTEAIRHSQAGFPEGLHDPLQGVGGTLNMDWWFTNHAVILDTAGRMIMENVAPGESSEWKELLRKIAEARPGCPINGLLLCISTETLIKESAEKFEADARQIARQLDVIQRSLDVRFPVFVLVTKCDLLNGFREFCEHVDTDPALQHQMLGWSNPADLDEPFRPETVDEHLSGVVSRLVARRQALLADPTPGGSSAEGRRSDEVDALFAFPEALSRIGPRLKRYLELIFVAGEWSPKPLFLRGIYFTSSMRHGAEMDEDLARALGVSVDSLPGGRVWDLEKSCFLRDLLIQKVFAERGLVTRAGNVRRERARRRAVLLGGVAVSAALVLGLTVAGYRGLTGRVNAAMSGGFDALHDVLFTEGEGGLEARPEAVRDAMLALVGPGEGGAPEYLGRSEPVEGAGVTRLGLLQGTQRGAREFGGVPLAFVLQRNISKGTDLAGAHRRVMDLAVLKPMYGLALEKLASETAWGETPTAALAEWARTLSLGLRPEGGPSEAVEQLAAPKPLELATLVLGEEGTAALAQDRAVIEQLVDDAYSQDVGWAGRLVAPEGSAEETVRLLRKAVGAFAASWGPEGSQWSMLGPVEEAVKAGLDVREREQALRGELQGILAETSRGGLGQRLRGDAWRRTLAGFEEITRGGERPGKVRRALAALGGRGVDQALDEAEKLGRETIRERHGEVLAALPDGGSDGGPDGGPEGDTLHDLRRALVQSEERAKTVLEERVSYLRQRLEGQGNEVGVSELLSGEPPVFEVLSELYSGANKGLQPAAPEDEPKALVGDLRLWLERAASGDEAAASWVETARRRGGVAAAAADVVGRARELASAARRARALEAWFHDGKVPVIPAEREATALSAAALSGDAERRAALAQRWSMPGVPAPGAAEAGFDPVAVRAILDDVNAARGALARSGESGLQVLDAGSFGVAVVAAGTASEDHARAFVAYWLQQAGGGEGLARGGRSWAEWRSALAGMNAAEVNARLGGALEAALSDWVPEQAWAGRDGQDRARARAWLERLKSAGHDDVCERTLAFIRSLPEDGESAAGAVRRAMGEGGFDERHAGAWWEQGGEGWWWNGLLSGVAAGLNAEQRSAEDRDWAALARLCGFPLALDSAGDLTREQVGEAEEIAGRLLGLEGGVGASRSPWNVLARELDGGLKSRLERVRSAAAAALATVGLVEIRDAGESRARMVFENVRVSVGGKVVGPEGRVSLRHPWLKGSIRAEHPSGMLRLEFDGAAGGASHDWSGPWWALRVLTVGRTSEALAGLGAGGQSSVEVEVPTGRPGVNWRMVLEFERPLPGLEAWPREGDWPAR